jgi:hypothetical protein
MIATTEILAGQIGTVASHAIARIELAGAYLRSTPEGQWAWDEEVFAASGVSLEFTALAVSVSRDYDEYRRHWRRETPTFFDWRYLRHAVRAHPNVLQAAD